MTTAVTIGTSSEEEETIKNRDMLALKAYVQAGDSARFDALKNTDLVLLDLTHSNLKQKHIEIRFALRDSVGYLKNRIHLKTGTPPHHQHLILYDGPSELAQIPSTDDTSTDSLPLGYFGLQYGMRVHCVDTNPHSGSAGGAYEDTNLIKKYEMSDAEYNARKGTLRDWARQQKMDDPNFNLKKHGDRQRAKAEATRLHKQGLPMPPGFYIDSRGEVDYDSDVEKDEAINTTTTEPTQSIESEYNTEDIELNMRCQVEPGSRRGKVGFVGDIGELPGNGPWVGVILDEPVGQNDGSVRGTMYMPETPGPRYGVFCRPNKVAVGDFPQRDFMDELEDSSEDEL
mmetsp:Transcript_813/g.1633  ORF Transcript_813/g.1633 Transcript_813/m.1633 type:complete len:342 (-) Transcript_813:454-1479(-)|eukprot:CAMPEP_0168863320 /NCGR_PEP_ID=MMETSP0727-20121128/18889_1 /TAXON_ID=265536 /ORGANISM="Amphiprora sp., Strain CCMP467" /LENGTH=341 /DNA_ID=CAMNT_0008918385 /DNA_START=84 /DNA_END=1109 /DNA_ORIENTATION=+